MRDSMENKEQDLQWVMPGLFKGTIICVTERSYNQKQTLNSSGAGIFLCCTKPQRMLHRNIYSESRIARSYTGDLLGLVALYTILVAIYCFATTSLPHHSRSVATPFPR